MNLKLTKKKTAKNCVMCSFLVKINKLDWFGLVWPCLQKEEEVLFALVLFIHILNFVS